MQKSFVNLIGKRIHRLRVIGPWKRQIYKSGRKKIKWQCVCDCGNIRFIDGEGLKCGRTKSCGCLRAELKKKRGGWNKLEKFEASKRALYRSYTESARKRDLKFNISLNDFYKITKCRCFYCNVIPKQTMPWVKSYGDYIFNGIDRVDNNLGYSINNCVPCCKKCNVMKGTLSVDEFLNIIKNICKHQEIKLQKFATRYKLTP